MTFYNAVFDFSGIEDIQQNITDIGDVFSNAMLNTAIELEQIYIPRLREYPDSRAKHPFQFATAKSRRYYFYLVNNGLVPTDGYGYVRNGGYANSWNVDIDQTGNEYRVTLYSTFPAAKYVGGERQVPGHTNTGWIKYNPILAEAGDFANRQFFEIVSSNV